MQCHKCFKDLPEDHFHKSNNNRGRSFYCKICRKDEWKSRGFRIHKTQCSICYLPKTLFDGNCVKCLKLLGLKPCKICKKIKIIGEFYDRKRVCKKCLGINAGPTTDRIGKFFIYGLFDPETKKLRYVGRNEGNVLKRLKQHLRDAKKGSPCPVHEWIRKLLEQGLSPDVYILDTCNTYKESIEIEHLTIKYWRSMLPDLTNVIG